MANQDKPRRSQVEKIKDARREVIAANDKPSATDADRRRAHARMDALMRNSSAAEWQQGFTEHTLS